MRPGFSGTSSNPGARSHAEAFPGDAEAVADALLYDKFCMFGNSIGGVATLATAASLSKRVLGCVVVSGDASYAEEAWNLKKGNYGVGVEPKEGRVGT